VVARLIDFVLQVVLAGTLFIALVLLLGLATLMGIVVPEDPLIAAIGVVVTVVAIIGYPILMETVTRGRTFGKMILGLRVVRDDGGPVTFRQALTRGLVGAAIEFPGLIGAPLTWLATFPVMLASPQGKRIGDHVAGTVVIHERTPSAWGWVPRMPGELAGWAATLDLSRLSDDLALACRQFLGRAASLTPPARERLGGELVAAVAATVTPPPPVGTPGWAYLTAVLSERRRRDEQRRTSNAPAASWAQPPAPPGWTPPAADPPATNWDRRPYAEPEPRHPPQPEPPGPFAPPA
jgi:uncharacterized RDD family membrane protein YckC